jgi:hypothetical protein
VTRTGLLNAAVAAVFFALGAVVCVLCLWLLRREGAPLAAGAVDGPAATRAMLGVASAPGPLTSTTIRAAEPGKGAVAGTSPARAGLAPPRLATPPARPRVATELTVDSDNLAFEDLGLADAVEGAMEASDGEMQPRLDDCLAQEVARRGGRAAAITTLGPKFHVHYDALIDIDRGTARVTAFEPTNGLDDLVACLREAEVWAQRPFPAPRAKHRSVRLQRDAFFYFGAAKEGD